MKALMATVMLVALIAGMSFMIPTKDASAWVDGVGRVDDISSWIVLDGLFNRRVDLGDPGVGLYNPIASWIVLDGLFGRGINDVGVDGIGGIGRGNDIASWIVLDGLFGRNFGIDGIGL